MARPHWHPSRCKVCGVPNRPGDRISQRGYCAEHGRERMLANHDALKSKRGPYARWWAYRLADGVWGMPIDEEPPRP